ncbi:retrotransposon protein, putative, ty3-gypsy subclass [Tanacetum coccineum]
MGHGSGHGSAHGSAHGSVPFHDDQDDSPVEEVSLVKPKKSSRRTTKAKKDEPKEAKEAPKEWTVAEEIALCQVWYFEKETGSSRANHESGINDLDVYHKACVEYKMIYTGDFTLEHCYNILKDHPGWKAVEMPSFYQSQGRKKSKTSETTSGSASGGLNLNEEVDEAVEETQEFRPMGRDRAKAKKKAVGSSRGGSSSFVNLVADKFYNMKSKNGERMTSNNNPVTRFKEEVNGRLQLSIKNCTELYNGATVMHTWMPKSRDAYNVSSICIQQVLLHLIWKSYSKAKKEELDEGDAYENQVKNVGSNEGESTDSDDGDGSQPDNEYECIRVANRDSGSGSAQIDPAFLDALLEELHAGVHQVGATWPILLGGQAHWTVGLVATLISISSIIAADTLAFAGGKGAIAMLPMHSLPTDIIEVAFGIEDVAEAATD